MKARLLAFLTGNWLELTLILATLGAVGWGIRSIRASGAEAERARLAEGIAENLRFQYERVRAERLEDSTRFAAEAQAIEVERQALLRRLTAAESLVRPTEALIRTAGATVDATLDSLRASVRPELVPVVDRLGGQLSEERRGHATLANIQAERIQTQAEVIAQQDSLANIRLAEYNGLWTEYNALIETEEQAEARIRDLLGRVDDGVGFGDVVKGALLIGAGYALYEVTK